MKILFLDESGDHNLKIIDNYYPIFVLAGSVIDENHHKNVLIPELFEFKKKLFGTKDIVLHYRDYTRNKKGFEKMKYKKFRNKFYKELNRIIKDTDFVLIACIIDKIEHEDRYGVLAIDPYTLSLEIVIERFIMLLEDKEEKGVIIAESRGQQLDNQIELEFLKFKIKGTRFFKPIKITDRIDNFIIRKKEDNIAGLQLVDALVTPIGRRYLNKKNYYLDYTVIKSKFRKDLSGKYMGYGLIILP